MVDKPTPEEEGSADGTDDEYLPEGDLDEALEGVIEGLRDGFVEDIRDRLAPLLSERLRAGPGTEFPWQDIFMLAHDLKGQAESFGFALAGEIAGLLCERLRARDGLGPPPTDVTIACLNGIDRLLANCVLGNGGEDGGRVTQKLKILLFAAE